MTTERDLERAVRAWIARGSEQLPDPALDMALEEISKTHQRHAGWLARRIPILDSKLLRFGIATVALVAVAILGLRFLPGSGGVGGPPATPVPLASGSFTASFGAIDLEATGSGANVSGVMHWSQEGDEFSLDLQCSRTTDDGLILIGGEATDVTHPEMAEGDRVAIALQPGTPVEAILWTEDGPPAASCPAFLESIPDQVANDLQPVVGDVELGP
jgi:hypothetical protein